MQILLELPGASPPADQEQKETGTTGGAIDQAAPQLPHSHHATVDSLFGSEKVVIGIAAK